MPRKNIKNRHKHKCKKINSEVNGGCAAPMLILIVPVSYLLVVILGAVNQLNK